MKAQTLAITSALALGLVLPTSAQMQTPHRYVQFFKYTDQSMKAMIESPQDRSAQIVKLVEGFGGKLESAYWFPMGNNWDGFNIVSFPDDITVEAAQMFVKASGSIARLEAYPIMTSEEFKMAMEKAKGIKTNWTPPAATKQ